MIEIISLIIAVVIIFVALFWFRKILFVFGFFFKALILVVLLLVVGSLVFGYYIIKDANDFKDNFKNSTSIILVKQTTNNEVSFIAATTFNPEKEEYKSVSKERLANITKLYNTNEFSKLNSEYYKIFVIDLNSFDNISLDKITDKNIDLTKEEIKQIMISSNAKEELATIISKKTGESKTAILKQISASNEELKSYVLSYYISTIFNPKDTTKFISQLKNGNIIIYKETALIKVIKLVPEKLIDIIIAGQMSNTTAK